MPTQDLAFDEDAYIVKEDAYVVITRDGWIKRQSSYSTLAKIRIRDEDSIGWLVLAHTRSTITFFTNLGSAYVMRVDDVPATAGYGEPLSATFSFADGERVVGVVPHDGRHATDDQVAAALATDDDPAPPHGVAVTERGRVLRFPMKPHTEPSTRAGRRYARLNRGDQVFRATLVRSPEDRVCLVTRKGRATVFPVVEVPVLKAAGKGVGGIKIPEADGIMAFELADDHTSGPSVTTSYGRDVVVSEKRYGSESYGGSGRTILKRGSIDTWHREPRMMLGPPPPPNPNPPPRPPTRRHSPARRPDVHRRE